MEAVKTLIYCTDNYIDEDIALMCREYLLSCGLPIVSVSQEPIDFGMNICVGRIGRSLESMFRQLLKGVEAAQTKYVSVTEHDCIYPMDYFAFEPPEDDVFYYNTNSYLVYPKEKSAFFLKRSGTIVALSQLTVCRDLFMEDLRERVNKLDSGYCFTSVPAARCEPGRSEYCGIFMHPESGEFIGLPQRKYQYWKSDTPVIDIRHSKNFVKMVSLPMVQDKRIPYWGTYEDIKRKLVG